MGNDAESPYAKSLLMEVATTKTDTTLLDSVSGTLLHML